MANNQDRFDEKVSIQSLDIKFTKKLCTIQVVLSNTLVEKLKIKFNEEKFNTTVDKTLRNKNVAALDIINLNNLYLIKLSEHLLVEVIKKSIIGINKLDSSAMLKDVRMDDIKSKESKQLLINDKVSLANSYVVEIINYMEGKFKRINEEIENLSCNVFDRSALIKKCKDEILDNVYKKHSLVVNEIIHYAYGRPFPESVIDEKKFLKIIENFK